MGFGGMTIIAASAIRLAKRTSDPKWEKARKWVVVVLVVVVTNPCRYCTLSLLPKVLEAMDVATALDNSVTFLTSETLIATVP